jgi:hypothetical protein
MARSARSPPQRGNVAWKGKAVANCGSKPAVLPDARAVPEKPTSGYEIRGASMRSFARRLRR